MKAIISKETLWHFQCPACEQWWAIGDYKGGAVIYCPRCHQKLEVEEPPPEEASAPVTLEGKDMAWLREHSLQGTCPPLTVKSPDTIRDEALEEAASYICTSSAWDELTIAFMRGWAARIRSLKTQP